MFLVYRNSHLLNLIRKQFIHMKTFTFRVDTIDDSTKSLICQFQSLLLIKFSLNCLEIIHNAQQ